MALNPIPIVAASSGDAADAPAGAIPFAAYGFGGGGGASGFPSTSPDGNVTVSFGDNGISLDAASGMDVQIGPSGLTVTSSSGTVQPILVAEVGGDVYVNASSAGNGFVSLAGTVNAMVPISQFAGTATLPAHLITKGYVDGKVPVPPASGTFVLKSVDGVTSWVAE